MPFFSLHLLALLQYANLIYKKHLFEQNSKWMCLSGDAPPNRLVGCLLFAMAANAENQQCACDCMEPLWITRHSQQNPIASFCQLVE